MAAEKRLKMQLEYTPKAYKPEGKQKGNPHSLFLKKSYAFQANLLIF